MVPEVTEIRLQTAGWRAVGFPREDTWYSLHGTEPASVRGPKYAIKRGKTPVLRPEEARALLDSINTSSIAGLRDRALIGVMVYSFARVGPRKRPSRNVQARRQKADEKVRPKLYVVFRAPEVALTGSIRN